MRRLIPAVIAAAAGLAAPGALAATDTILPGYWEAAYSIMGIGKTERWCIQPKDIAKFMHGPSNHIYKCEYPVSEAGGGEVRFEGECHSRKGRHVILKGHGDYSPTTLNVKMSVKGGVSLVGIPITVTPSMRARLISQTCPPGAKAFK